MAAPQVPPVRERQAHALRDGRRRGADELRGPGRPWQISGRFIDHRGIDTNAIELGFRYPYQWSNTGDRIKHWCFVLPVDERTSRVFFVFFFDAHRLPGTPVRLPRAVVRALLGVSKWVLLRPLLSQDGAAVEAEQEAWDRHFSQSVPELNPAIGLMQQLIVRKWDEHLARRTEIGGTEWAPQTPIARRGHRRLLGLPEHERRCRRTRGACGPWLRLCH